MPRILNGSLVHENMLESCDFHVNSWIHLVALHLQAKAFGIGKSGIQQSPLKFLANGDGGLHPILQVRK